MATKAKRHIHKYHKVELAFSKVWACALPDCNHYMPAHLEPMVTGKASLCWECGEKIILDPINMQDDRPTCDACRGVSDYDDAVPKSMINRLGVK